MGYINVELTYSMSSGPDLSGEKRCDLEYSTNGFDYTQINNINSKNIDKSSITFNTWTVDNIPLLKIRLTNVYGGCDCYYNDLILYGSTTTPTETPITLTDNPTTSIPTTTVPTTYPHHSLHYGKLHQNALNNLNKTSTDKSNLNRKVNTNPSPIKYTHSSSQLSTSHHQRINSLSLSSFGPSFTGNHSRKHSLSGQQDIMNEHLIVLVLFLNKNFKNKGHIIVNVWLTHI